MIKKKLTTSLFLGALILLLASCQQTNDAEETGTIKLSLTDAPFPIELLESANVTITKIEIREKSDSSDAVFTVIMEDTVAFNLLDFRNGVTAELLELELPVGSYDLIRLYVDSASISIIDGDTYALKVPGGSESGIKIFIKPALEISGGLTSELLLDFNIERSFVLKGNMNTPAGIKGFNFKPVIRVANLSSSGTLEGIVSDTSMTVLENAEVWIEADTVVSVAFTDESGYYAMPGVPAGTYSVYATKSSFDTIMVSDIEIVAANKTEESFILTPQE